MTTGTHVIEVKNLTKRYRDVVAVDDVSFTIEKDTIYGLLGRNGAGKTTVMSILTAQNFATSGDIRVFGMHPYENAKVLSRMCFVRESQKYPDDALPRHAFAAAADERLDGGCIADDVRGAVAHGVRCLVHDDAPTVDDEDALDEVGDLVDQVARQDHRAGVIGVVLQETVVEDLARDGVETQVGLVEEGDLGARGETDDDADG